MPFYPSVQCEVWRRFPEEHGGAHDGAHHAARTHELDCVQNVFGIVTAIERRVHDRGIEWTMVFWLEGKKVGSDEGVGGGREDISMPL
jgi:hypothetical protein